MRIPRIYLPDAESGMQQLPLDERALNYTRRVLRLRQGDAIQVFNGKGIVFDAVIGDRRADVQQELPASQRPAREVFLLQGISKGDRMDTVVQKTTELGVSGIFPVFTEHCVVNMDSDRAKRRQARWQEIAINASEQCGRDFLPTIHSPEKLEQLLPRLTTPGTRLVCKLNGQQKLDALINAEPVYVLIGPEGGLSDADQTCAIEHDFLPWQLGQHVLRTETAAIAAVTLLQYQSRISV